eukprot:ctg_1112.g354
MEAERDGEARQYAEEYCQLLEWVSGRLEQYVRQVLSEGASVPGEPAAGDGARHRPVDGRVVDYRPPKEVESIVGRHFQCWREGATRESLKALRALVDDVLTWSVRTQHPFFLHRLFAGADPVGQVAELLLATVNTSADTYTAAPFLTVLERRVVQALCERVGWEGGEGIFCAGGSFSNLVAMATARHALDALPQAADRRPRLAVFTSAQSHYGIRRNAVLMGLVDAPGHVDRDVYLVPCDANGCMEVEALRAMLVAFRRQRPDSQVLVNATAGTTVLSAFDPIRATHRVLVEAFVDDDDDDDDDDDAAVESERQPRFWLHVDGALGGALLFSPTLRAAALDGLAECADSFALSAHKLLGAPQQCSVLLMRQRGRLHAAHSARAQYLFHDDDDQDDGAARWDLGDMTLTCGRRSDALKFWMMWMWRGDAGWAARVERAVQAARHLAREASQRHGFVLVGRDAEREQTFSPPYTNVCFYYVPRPWRQRWRTLEQIRCDAEPQRLQALTAAICRRLRHTGQALLNYSPLEDQHLPPFLRVALNSPWAGDGRHRRHLLDLIEDAGEAWSVQQPAAP